VAVRQDGSKRSEKEVEEPATRDATPPSEEDEEDE
jgi:hypothetical protein